MEIRYPESQPIRLHLKRATWTQDMLDHVEGQTGRGGEIRELLPMFASTRRRASFIVSEAEVGQQKVALWDRRESVDPTNQQTAGGSAESQNTRPGTWCGRATPAIIESVTPVRSGGSGKTKPDAKEKAEDEPSVTRETDKKGPIRDSAAPADLPRPPSN